jgi:hypothetical protein
LLVAGGGLLVLAVAAWWAVTGPLGSLGALGDRKVIKPEDVAACGPAWRVVQSPDPSKEYSELHAIAATMSGEMWAVGTNGTEEYALTLTERWDGKAWTFVQSPSVPEYSNHLHGVVAFASDDAWTVGASHRGTDLWRTLTMHWDGAKWSIVPSPTIPPVSNLNAVAGAVTTDIWAVGEQSSGERGTGPRPLILRWDGKAWHIVTMDFSIFSGTLNGVTALSSDNVWAVGSYTDSPTSSSRPLVVHWDGHGWKQVQTPSTGELYAVVASGAGEVWAVGNNHQRTLAMRWEGQEWKVTPSPNPGNRGDVLNGVAVVGKDDVWAVGALSDDEGDATLALHWDGREWKHSPSPSKGTNAATFSGVTVAGGAEWAAGSYIADPSGTNLTIVERFSDPCSNGK